MANPFCQAGQAIQDVADDAIKNWAKAIADAAGQTAKTLGTFWVNAGTPNLTAAPGGTTASDPVLFLQSSLYFWTAALGVLSVLVGAGKMIIERRGPRCGTWAARSRRSLSSRVPASRLSGS
ncbi:hypothetical protein [Paenarthrobacter sp. C1]|uniref:hypothetical protein n=1 Tax=Paenarthrobacter sp. C1 TaxID=3400220 RepID=UPI003BF575D6